jgi:hypothetical protein
MEERGDRHTSRTDENRWGAETREGASRSGRQATSLLLFPVPLPSVPTATHVPRGDRLTPVCRTINVCVCVPCVVVVASQRCRARNSERPRRRVALALILEVVVFLRARIEGIAASPVLL